MRLPEGAAPEVSAQYGELISGTYAASSPDQEPGRILIPGDGAAGDQGLRIGRPGDGGYATPAACRLNDFLGAMISGAHRLVAGRVKSTSIRVVKTRPG